MFNLHAYKKYNYIFKMFSDITHMECIEVNELTLLLLSSSFLRKNKVPFLLENVSNLTYEFLYDNFNKKI